MRLLTKMVLAMAAPLSLTAAAGAEPVGLFPTVLCENTTGVHYIAFVFAPDVIYAGLGGQVVTYDFGDFRIVDGAGGDFNVYEASFNVPEFNTLSVFVSEDGTTFVDVTATQAAAVNILGDEAHSLADYRQSYDIASSGLTSVRYVRLDGVGNGAGGGTNDFDLDAIGAVNYAEVNAVPLPGAVWGGLALLGGLGAGNRLRRRNASRSASVA